MESSHELGLRVFKRAASDPSSLTMTMTMSESQHGMLNMWATSQSRKKSGRSILPVTSKSPHLGCIYAPLWRSLYQSMHRLLRVQI